MTQDTLLATLHERQLCHQITNESGLHKVLSEGPVTAYCGFDATADSLHVGHLMSLTVLRHIGSHGHKPVALIGGKTTEVGDPSFRVKTRRPLSSAEISANAEGIRTNIAAFFSEAATKPEFVDNADWLSTIGHLEFLRTVGRHFSVARMLTFDSVRTRLEAQEPLSFMEFGYMLLQAMDFLELNRRKGCVLQVGGSDQWGNIVNGVELGRRSDGVELFGLTTPLLTNTSGEKMGKTAAGAVWLSAERLSPNQFWNFWRNVDDADVGRFLTQLTIIPISGIEEVVRRDINEAKIRLANAMTDLVHGSGASGPIAAAMAKADPTTLDGLETWEVIFGDRDSIPFAEALRNGGLVKSVSEGRRLIDQGGIKLAGKVVDRGDLHILRQDVPRDGVLLTIGKRRRLRLVACSAT